MPLTTQAILRYLADMIIPVCQNLKHYGRRFGVPCYRPQYEFTAVLCKEPISSHR